MDSYAITALLLAENITPAFTTTYNASVVRTSMQAMRAVLKNRVTWDTDHPSAPLFSRPATSLDAIRKPGQFPEFVPDGSGIGYSANSEGINARKNINEMFAIANDSKRPLHAAYRDHILLAMSVASTDGSFDPYQHAGGTYFWNKGAALTSKVTPIPDSPVLPGKLLGNQFWTVKGQDVVLIIDSTGSMEDDIDGVRKSAEELVSRLFKSDPNSRVAIVTYKDPGEVSIDNVFTAKQSTVVSGIKNISVGGGGDTPEGVYSGILTALKDDAASLGKWRTNPMGRAVIVMGDAPAKDPELKAQVSEAVRDKDVTITINAPSSRSASRSAIAPLTTETTIPGAPIRVYTVSIGGDSSVDEEFSAIANLSEFGRSYTAGNATEAVEALSSALQLASSTLQGEVAVFLGESEILDELGTVDFIAGAPLSKTFTVRNTGATSLIVGDVSVPNGFRVTSNLGNSTVIAAGGSATFTISLTSKPSQARLGTVRFLTSDPDEALFNFRVFASPNQGNGPRLKVMNGATELRNGESTVDFGTVTAGQSKTVFLKITNSGTQPLALSPVTVTDGFSATVNLPKNKVVKAGATVTIAIRFRARTAGAYNGTLQLLSSDNSANPFEISLSGIVRASTAPNPTSNT